MNVLDFPAGHDVATLLEGIGHGLLPFLVLKHRVDDLRNKLKQVETS